MLQVKQIKLSKILPVIVFVTLFLLTRLPFLSRDSINPDAVNWHYRSEQFMVALKAHQWASTYQHYHPGVTLMWIMGPVVEILKHTSHSLASYNNNNFLNFDFASKAALIAVQLVLSLIALFLLSKLIEYKKALFTVFLFSLEPFFIGNSRLLHMDVLLTLFLFNGLLLVYWTQKNYVWWKALLAGVFLSLAFLTKSIGIGALLFSALYLLYTRSFKTLGFFVLAFLATTFILFPALWVKPVFTISQIFSEGERIGVREGHGQIIMGDYTTEAGPEFYPLILLLKLSPFMLIGLVLCVIKNLQFTKERLINLFKQIPLEFYLFIFYFGYFIVMTYPTKKIDRYMIPVFPFVALLAAGGYLWVKKYQMILVSSLASAFILLPLISFYPYYFTYTSPLFGSTSNANKVIAQKSFGIGIPALKDFIFAKYGQYPKLGFYDVKPMKSIYMNSRICDIRVCGTSSYDILVLGINEELPEAIQKGRGNFVQDSSLYINGLEYWKIYVKKP